MGVEKLTNALNSYKVASYKLREHVENILQKVAVITSIMEEDIPLRLINVEKEYGTDVYFIVTGSAILYKILSDGYPNHILTADEVKLEHLTYFELTSIAKEIPNAITELISELQSRVKSIKVLIEQLETIISKLEE